MQIEPNTVERHRGRITSTLPARRMATGVVLQQRTGILQCRRHINATQALPLIAQPPGIGIPQSICTAHSCSTHGSRLRWRQ